MENGILRTVFCPIQIRFSIFGGMPARQRREKQPPCIKMPYLILIHAAFRKNFIAFLEKIAYN